MDDIDPGFNVGEGVGRGQDSFALELLVQLPVSSAVQGEGGAVHEPPQVVVFVEVSDPVLHLIGVKVGLHVGYLNVGLQEGTRVCVVRYGAGGDELTPTPLLFSSAITQFASFSLEVTSGRTRTLFCLYSEKSHSHGQRLGVLVAAQQFLGWIKHSTLPLSPHALHIKCFLPFLVDNALP